MKSFTLTHLSPLLQRCFWDGFKSRDALTPAIVVVTGGSGKWNIAETLGTRNAKGTILKSTFFSEVKDYQSAGDAGADLRKRMWSGENLQSFGINCARSFVGKNVNLHLKDGSVIVNVLLEEIQEEELNRQRFITCVPYRDKNAFRIPLKNIAWAESLNLNLIKGGRPA